MKRTIFLILLLLLLSILSACRISDDTEFSSDIIDHATSTADISQPESQTQEPNSKIPSEEHELVKIQITVGDTTLTAIPEENSSSEAFLDFLQKGPVTVQMSDYAGMEKVGSLGTNLPRNDAQIRVDAGDLVLYQDNQITIYYGKNSWSLTKLAVIEGATKESLLEVLGTGNVDVTFSLAQ